MWIFKMTWSFILYICSVHVFIALYSVSPFQAIKEQKKKFNFMGYDIRLLKTVGIFVTMNPGYAGRYLPNFKSNILI